MFTYDDWVFYEPPRVFSVRSLNSTFKSTFTNGYEVEGEKHNFWEMVMVLEGEITVTEDEKIYNLSAGEVIFHAPLEFHRIVTRKNIPSSFMIISFAVDGQLPSSLKNGVFLLSKQKNENIEKIYSDITAVLDCSSKPMITHRNGVSLLDEQRVITQFELFLISMESASPKNKDGTDKKSHVKYKVLSTMLMEGVDKNMSLQEMSTQSGISVSSIKRIFKKYAGCSPTEYYSGIRMTRAGKLILKGMSVSEVSRIMNFSSPNYFCAVFKKKFGVAPSKYVSE